MSAYNIIFDNNKKIECLNYYSIKKNKDNIYISDNHCKINPVGTFLLEFINTNFDDINEFKNFVLKYCFEDLLLKLNKEKKLNIKKYYKNSCLSIDENSLYKLFSFMELNYLDDFVYFKDLILKLTTKIIIDEETDKELREYADVEDPDDSRTSDEIYTDLKQQYLSVFNYENNLNELNLYLNDVKMDFKMDDFYFFHKELKLYKNIPYSFESSDCFNILLLSFKQLNYINSDILIQKCANCNKYFIPKTLHDTKYCDEIYKDNKTCKEIGRELTFKENLEKEPLLKAYRSRYQTLSKQASEREKHEMYDYFKKEGPVMRKKFINGDISSEEFKNWIDSTKIKKTSKV